jgi:NADH-quinone oxidoreductase subunit C
VSAEQPAEQIAERLARALGETPGEPALRASTSAGVLTADVPARRWLEALSAARDELGFTFFDWLTAVDEGEAGFDVVVHLWAPAAREHLQLRTRVPRDSPRLASACGVFGGADWCERETFEMFGVAFDGHPGLAPLLLPDGFEGHPLRKDFVLASRVARDWPGAAEPGGQVRRRPARPPGVPEPGTWGSA